jgi:hypothetical protein
LWCCSVVPTLVWPADVTLLAFGLLVLMCGVWGLTEWLLSHESFRRGRGRAGRGERGALPGQRAVGAGHGHGAPGRRWHDRGSAAGTRGRHHRRPRVKLRSGGGSVSQSMDTPSTSSG